MSSPYDDPDAGPQLAGWFFWLIVLGVYASPFVALVIVGIMIGLAIAR